MNSNNIFHQSVLVSCRKKSKEVRNYEKTWLRFNIGTWTHIKSLQSGSFNISGLFWTTFYLKPVLIGEKYYQNSSHKRTYPINAQNLYEICLISVFRKIGTFLVILATFGIEIVIRWWKIFFWCSVLVKNINISELFVCTIHQTLILLGIKPLNRDYSKKFRHISFSLPPFKPDFHAISKKVQHSYSTFRLDLPFDFEQSARLNLSKT